MREGEREDEQAVKLKMLQKTRVGGLEPAKPTQLPNFGQLGQKRLKKTYLFKFVQKYKDKAKVRRKVQELITTVLQARNWSLRGLEVVAIIIKKNVVLVRHL